MQLSDCIAKADVLVEALPYIADFRGEMIVVKIGGSVQEDAAALGALLTDVAFMHVVGMRPVVVHGGGKAISRALADAGVETKFLAGLRVTDERSIGIVEDVIKNKVGVAIVASLCERGVAAEQLPGDRVFFAERKTGVDPASGKALDWGFVGDAVHCDTGPVRASLESGHIPVICPLGRDASGRVLNINADDAAAAIASALPSRKLVYVSDVPGLLRDPSDPESLIGTLHVSEAPAMERDGTISGGMIPKVESSLAALRAGVRKVHFVDGRMPHSLLLEMFTDKGVGTQIVKDAPAAPASGAAAKGNF